MFCDREMTETCGIAGKDAEGFLEHPESEIYSEAESVTVTPS